MIFRTLRSKCALLAAVCLLALGAASHAAADSISLEWDPSGGEVGYRVHVGTQSGSYTQHFDVGSGTLFTFQTATAGQRYCFAVSAYLLSSQLEGPNSGEVCGYSNAPPTLVNPGNRTSPVGQAVALQLVGSDPASQPLTYGATGLPPGLSLMVSTGYISGTPTTAGTYSVTVQAFDGLLNASQTFSWVITGGGSSSDTTRPTTSIDSPTTGTAYATGSSTIALSGAAADNVGVTQVRWSNDRGGSGVASGTTSWSVSGIALQSGENLIIITALDAAGNQGTDYVRVTVSGSGGGGGGGSTDTTRPTVSVRTPTTGTLYSTTASTIAMTGDAADNVGVTQVRWSNDRGGSGVASGTTNWSLSGIALQSGENLIIITAVDAAGNQGTDYVYVTLGGGGGGGGGGSTDTTRPTVSIRTPTTGTAYATSSSTIAMTGDAADNVGVTQVRWSNDRGGSGVASGTTSWSVSGIALQSGENLIIITALDAAGNQGTDYVRVTLSGSGGGGGGGGTDSTRPTVSVRTPTTGTLYSTTASTIAMSGDAADNVGVSQVRWSNDRGGSGIATGTTSWSVSGIALQSGENLIIITAVDAAGNQGTDYVYMTLSGGGGGGGGSTDTTRPTVSIRTPTTGTAYSTSSSTIAMSGDAADNVGVTQVRWSNDRGGSGVATGTTSWGLSGIPLQSGTNLIIITAVDAAGNQGTDYVYVTYTGGSSSDTTQPTVSVSTPTSQTYYSAYAPTVGLGGTAADNVGVTQVRWSNDRGGSGVASGTTNWSASLSLLPGANGFTITAVDAAGNQATDFISVYYNVP